MYNHLFLSHSYPTISHLTQLARHANQLMMNSNTLSTLSLPIFFDRDLVHNDFSSFQPCFPSSSEPTYEALNRRHTLVGREKKVRGRVMNREELTTAVCQHRLKPREREKERVDHRNHGTHTHQSTKDEAIERRRKKWQVLPNIEKRTEDC